MDICILHLYTLSIHIQIASQFPPTTSMGTTETGRGYAVISELADQKQQMSHYCAFEIGEKAKNNSQQNHPLKPKAARTCPV